MSIINTLFSAARNIVAKIALFRLDYAFYTTAFVGMCTILAGLYKDAMYDSALFESGGASALNAYHKALQLAPIESVSAYLMTGLHWDLPSAGGNYQATGLIIAYVGSAAVCGAVAVARLIARPQTSPKAIVA